MAVRQRSQAVTRPGPDRAPSRSQDAPLAVERSFPGSSSYKTQVLKSGHLIKSLYGYDDKGELIKDSHRVINSLDDIRHILRLRPDQIQITTTDDSLFLVKTSSIIPEDKQIVKEFNIDHSYLLE